MGSVESYCRAEMETDMKVLSIISKATQSIPFRTLLQSGALVAGLCIVRPAVGENGATSAPASRDRQWFECWNWDSATHGMFGIRPHLGDRGCIFDATFTADVAKNLRGGLNTEGYNVGHLLNVSITLETEKLHLWNGGELQLSFQNENGEFASADAGDLQGIDNIDADGRTQIAELWLGQSFLDDQLKLKLGKIDANADFNVAQYSAEFLHSSAGMSPTVLGMPSYPDAAMGAQLIFDGERYYLGGGIFDGAAQEGISTGDKGPATFIGKPSDLFLVLEGGPKWKLNGGTLPGKLGVGVWHHTGTFDRFDGGTERGTSGLYLQASQLIYSETGDNNDGCQGIGVFCRYGWADANVSVIEHHIGCGIAWTGALPTRDHDSFGLGINTALLSQEDGAGVDRRAETSVELFYKIQVMPWLYVQPDVQYIVNPGGVSDNQDALLATVRLMVNL